MELHLDICKKNKKTNNCAQTHKRLNKCVDVGRNKCALVVVLEEKLIVF